jgi:hypothetical protein
MLQDKPPADRVTWHEENFRNVEMKTGAGLKAGLVSLPKAGKVLLPPQTIQQPCNFAFAL